MEKPFFVFISTGVQNGCEARGAGAAAPARPLLCVGRKARALPCFQRVLSAAPHAVLLAALLADGAFPSSLAVLLPPAPSPRLRAVPPALLRHGGPFRDMRALAKPGSGRVRPRCERQTAAKSKVKLSVSLGNSPQKRQRVPEFGRR